MMSFIIIATILLITLVILLFMYRKLNNDLLAELKTGKEKHEALKEEAVLLGLILGRVSILIRNNLAPLPKHKMPFTIKGINDTYYSELTSLRFKKVENEVLVFINGAMVPYIGEIKLNHANFFTNTNLNDIDDIINILNKKKYGGNNILKDLKQINQNLNN